MNKPSLRPFFDLLRSKKKPERSHSRMEPAQAPQQVYTPYDEKRLKQKLDERMAAHRIAREHRTRAGLRRGEVDRER